MELVHQVVDVFLHLDRHLNEWAADLGPWTYVVLFLVIFCETGLVVTPFLPGDSLLFAVGALAATEGSAIQVVPITLLLIAAAIVGDNLNYWIGRKIGPKVFKSESARFFNRKHLVRTQAFYDRHGGKTIVMARFVPIVRTFAPFVAGIGRMPYARFISFSVGGGAVWVSLFTFTGFWFGNQPAIKRNFHYVIVAIILISLLPMAVEYLRARAAAKRSAG